MKKIFVLTFLVFSNIFLIYSESMHWNFSPYMKFRYGQQNEYVFCKSKLEKKHKLSELNWEQKQIMFWGLDGNLFWNGFMFGMNFQKAFNRETGIVKDSDWLNTETVNETYAFNQTNYSENSCILDDAYAFEVTASYSFRPTEWFSFGPAAKIQYEYSLFKAKGGWYQYGKDCYTGTVGKKYTEGEVIKFNSDEIAMSLERSYYFVWTGLASSFAFKNFSSSIGFFGCSYSFIDSIDSHLMSGTFYFDHMEGHFCAYKFFLDMQYFLTRHQSVCFSFSYLDTDILTGNTRTSGDSPDGSYGLALGKAGSSFNFVDFSLGYRICF